MTTSKIKSLFLLLAISEGVSYLFLLFIAMPLKYIWNYPVFVSIAGASHGALFTLYILWIWAWRNNLNWSIRKSLWISFQAILPWGPFLVHSKIRKESIEEPF
jgi:integral membrane protein